MSPRTDPFSPLPQPQGLAEAPHPFRHAEAAELTRIPHPRPPAFDLPLPADPRRDPPDPDLLTRFGAAEALRNGILPWRRCNGTTLILTARPQDFTRCAPALTACYGAPLRPLPCPRPLIEEALLAHAAPALTAAAETRPAAIDSARSFGRRAVALCCALLLLALATATAVWPLGVLLALFALSALSLLAVTLLKCAAAIAAAAAPDPDPAPVSDPDLPTLSLLVALYGEAGIAPRLIRRLSALDYPRDRLDTVLLVEEEDIPTRIALANTPLPAWMRVIAVPKGHIRTKPRALNFGLDFTRGSIIGIYDAEDAPDPQQLRRVAAAFAAAPPSIACLQGMLDFYNPTTNWIARGFTMEYAVWFRLILPGLERLGLPIPLGGTTLFLRRSAVVEVGGWDAHNVTEDADLGIRLARHGWQTRILASVTREEANCRAIPWIRQRSRWTKGYLMTWLVHMRRPLRLWHELGPVGFIGFQITILGGLLQALFAPLHWSLLIWPPFADHPLAMAVGPTGIAALLCLYLFSQLSGLVLIATALRLAGHRPQWPWLLVTVPYFLLTTCAALKALAEAALRPFHWDKTGHGHFDQFA